MMRTVDCSGAVAPAPFMPPLKLKRRWLRTATEYSVGKVFAALLVVDPALTAAAYFENRFEDGGFGSDSTWTATCVVAVVLCHYCLSTLTDERGDTTDAQRDAVGLPKKFTTLGFCDYVIDAVHPLASPHWLGMEGPLEFDPIGIGILSGQLANAQLSCGKPLDEVLRESGSGAPRTLFQKSMMEAACIVATDLDLVQTVRLGFKLPSAKMLQSGQPELRHLRHFMTTQKVAFHERPERVHDERFSAQGVLLQVPTNFKDEVPLAKFRRTQKDATLTGANIVHQLKFSKNLRDQALHQQALVDAIDVLFQDPEEADAVTAKSTTHVASRQTLLKARIRCDAMGCLIERREIAQIVQLCILVSAHIYTDGSPVTGTEVQGMLLELFTADGTLHLFYLPGMALLYGLTRTIDKAIALLWSLWLVTGTKKVFIAVWNVHVVSKRVFL